MARSFDPTGSPGDNLTSSAAPVTAAPFTMACWFNPDVANAVLTLMSLSNGSNNFHRLFLHGAAGGDPIGAQSQGTGSFGTSSAGINGTTGVWYHAAGVWASATSRTAYFNGGNAGSDSGNSTPTVTQTDIGWNAGNGTAYEEFDGSLAECGLWNAALTAAEIAVLGKGVSPLFVRPQNLVGYWPLWGRSAAEIDLTGGNDMTVSGAAAAAHAPIIYPYQPPMRVVAPAAVGGNLMVNLAGSGGLAGPGGLAGIGGGLAA